MNRVVVALLAPSLALLLGGCGPAVHPVEPVVQKFDQPPLNQTATAELGDTIIDKGTSITMDALILDAPVSSGDGVFTAKYTVLPGTLVAKDETEQERFYYAQAITVFNGFNTFNDAGGIKVTHDDKTWAIFHGANAAALPIPAGSARHTKVTVTDRPSVRQELLYDGRTGSAVKFSYREFDQDSARPAFTQDVQYDLNDSQTIGFKGARVQIVKATNTQLTYVVLATFPDRT